MLIDLETRGDGDGGWELTARAGSTAWRLVLGREELSERAKLLELVARNRDAFDRGSYWFTGERAHDRRVALLDGALLDLHAWDLRSIIAPLFTQLEHRFPGARWVLVTEGRPDLQLFNPRGAIRVGVLRRWLHPRVLSDVSALQAWAGRGCAALATLTEPRALPRFVGTAIEMLIAAPRSELDEYLEAVGVDRGDRAQLEELLETDAARISAIMARAEWQDRLLAELRAAAAGVGATVRENATRRDLAEALARGSPERLLILVAHQDDAGLHLADGVFPIAVLAGYLHALRESGAAPFGSVELGVCGAEAEGNLADCLQAFGAPIVHTQGRFAHYGRMLAAWSWAFQELRDAGGPLSLPELLDRGWLRAWAGQPPLQLSWSYTPPR